MDKLFGFVLSLAGLFGLGNLFAQAGPLEGNWYSNGTVVIEGSTNNYLGELRIKQKGRTFTGEFNYYFRDSLFTNKIEGVFDLSSRYMIIKPFPVILHSSTSTKTGVDCYMDGEFLLRISRVGSYLAGKFIAEPQYKYTCPEIAFDFEKNNDAITPIDEAKQASVAAAQTTKQDTFALAKDPIVELTKKQFEERPKDFFKEMTVNSKTINLEFTDNGVIDYDSISVFLNGNLLLKETMLTHTPIKLKLTLNDSLPFNELCMFANNEGLIPPNTATMILTDGDDKYEVEMNSSLHRTATIKLLRRKK